MNRPLRNAVGDLAGRILGRQLDHGGYAMVSAAERSVNGPQIVVSACMSLMGAGSTVGDNPESGGVNPRA